MSITKTYFPSYARYIATDSMNKTVLSRIDCTPQAGLFGTWKLNLKYDKCLPDTSHIILNRRTDI